MTTTDETRVREALRHATDDLTAPVHRLSETAAFRGRRLRRRRRLGTVVGTICAVTAIVVPVGITLGGAGSTAGTPIATDPTPTPSQPAPTPEPDPPATDDAGWAKMPATQMLAVLESLTPDGLGYTDTMVTNEDRAPGERERVMQGYLLADVVANGRTAGAINVMLMGPGAPSSRYTCPGNLIAPDSCTELTDDSGATTGRRSTSTTGGVTVFEVVLRGPGGGLVYVAATNSDDDKWGAGSSIASDSVPLTMEQVSAIAADPAWTDWVPASRSRQ